MRWNWDFLRNRKTDFPQAMLGANGGVRSDVKMIMINGVGREIVGADLADMEVAGRIRMLMRGQIDHEPVCELARDRIVYLADRLGEIEDAPLEAIAKIIDPRAWAEWDAYHRQMRDDGKADAIARQMADYHWLEDKTKALFKAAQILALITGKPAPDPVEEQEAVLKNIGAPT